VADVVAALPTPETSEVGWVDFKDVRPEGMSKEDFDREIMAAAGRREILLSRANSAGTDSPEMRDGYVHDPRDGSYYHGALRNPDGGGRRPTEGGGGGGASDNVSPSDRLDALASRAAKAGAAKEPRAELEKQVAAFAELPTNELKDVLQRKGYKNLKTRKAMLAVVDDLVLGAYEVNLGGNG
jgi:hypothetical protein